MMGIVVSHGVMETSEYTEVGAMFTCAECGRQVHIDFATGTLSTIEKGDQYARHEAVVGPVDLGGVVGPVDLSGVVEA